MWATGLSAILRNPLRQGGKIGFVEGWHDTILVTTVSGPHTVGV